MCNSNHLKQMCEYLTKEEAQKRIRENRLFSDDTFERKDLQPMIRVYPEKTDVSIERKNLQPMIQVFSERNDSSDKSTETNLMPNQKVTNENGSEVGMESYDQILSFIPYDNDSVNTIPFYQKHPENTIGWTELYLKATKKKLVYSIEEKQFRQWNGSYWENTTHEEVQKDVIVTIKQYYYHSKNTPSEDDAVKSGNFKSLKGIVETLKSLKGKRASEFNRTERCICVKNGVYSFDTNTLHPHYAYMECYITYMIAVNYTPGYKDPIFSNFLKSIMLDYENERCLQRIYGYPLLGDPKEQLCFILTGSGANGKSTLNNAVQNVVKDLATVMRIEYFTSATTSNPDAPSPATYQLKDKLYAFTSEGKAGISLNDAQVKKHIGGGKLIARKPYCDLVEFDSKFVLFFDTNHVPHFSEGGYSMERRVVIIPFPATFKGSSLNKDMNKLLASESCKMAMLAWLIEGTVSYKIYGLQLTPRIVEATKQYFLAEDTIGAFFNECIIDDERGRVTMMDLYKAYKMYCDQNLVEAKNKDVFSKSEFIKKYPRSRSNKLGRFRTGLRLKDDYINL